MAGIQFDVHKYIQHLDAFRRVNRNYEESNEYYFLTTHYLLLTFLSNDILSLAPSLRGTL